MPGQVVLGDVPATPGSQTEPSPQEHVGGGVMLQVPPRPMPSQGKQGLTHLEVRNVHLLPDTEFLPHEPQFGHAVKDHAVELQWGQARVRGGGKGARREAPGREVSLGQGMQGVWPRGGLGLRRRAHQEEVAVLGCATLGRQLLNVALLDELVGRVDNVLLPSQPLVHLQELVHLLLWETGLRRPVATRAGLMAGDPERTGDRPAKVSGEAGAEPADHGSGKMWDRAEDSSQSGGSP